MGGGPAGLYFAILMKKADPRHEITVAERNPADATFGFGVVFSEETMGELRDADYETWLTITETFAHWNAIDIVRGGKRLRSRGHAFSAISRKVLLQILQQRAAALGVELTFETEVDGVADFDADLVVGSDGVNSTVRGLFAGSFVPAVRPYDSRYVWFGTDLVFDAFTFVFRETEHGMFQVHAYPFDAETSTFIVECSRATWERAGLEGSNEEETIAFCRDLFADELGGHSLLSNRSVWLTFLEVRNENWHTGNVVLLGDAAHTAHFTIGSGTKLALEDAIALAEAFQRRPGELERALAEYELDRQPVVERFQEAARESATYFENVKRYAEFDLRQFAFNLLTRSGRITYTNLTLRDPEFCRHLDERFAGRIVAPPPMFAPIELGGTALPNRVAVSPEEPDDGEEGLPGGALEQRLVDAAATGAGLVVTPLVAVSPAGRLTPGTTGLYEREHAEAWARIVAAVQRASEARVAIQLGHAGPRGATRPRAEGVDLPLAGEGWPLLAASPRPYTPISRIPRQLSRADMDGVRDDFVAAARAAAEVGFDGLELHLAHGHLLATFISPLLNQREDEYGGPLENRLRFPLEVLDAVRAVWPADRLLAVRFTADDWARGGIRQAEALAAARAFGEHGAVLLVPVAGQTVPSGSPQYRRGFLVPYADAVRTQAGVATLATGAITTADQVNTIVGAGRADLCLLELGAGGSY